MKKMIYTVSAIGFISKLSKSMHEHGIEKFYVVPYQDDYGRDNNEGRVGITTTRIRRALSVAKYLWSVADKLAFQKWNGSEGIILEFDKKRGKITIEASHTSFDEALNLAKRVEHGK